MPRNKQRKDKAIGNWLNKLFNKNYRGIKNVQCALICIIQQDIITQ